MTDKPFSADHVLRVTLRHMQRQINISIQKTIIRMSEFTDNPEKAKEALFTLGELGRLNALLEEICNHNKDIFKDA